MASIVLSIKILEKRTDTGWAEVVRRYIQKKYMIWPSYHKVSTEGQVISFLVNHGWLLTHECESGQLHLWFSDRLRPVQKYS